AVRACRPAAGGRQAARGGDGGQGVGRPDGGRGAGQPAGQEGLPVARLATPEEDPQPLQTDRRADTVTSGCSRPRGSSYRPWLGSCSPTGWAWEQDPPGSPCIRRCPHASFVSVAP